MANRRGGRRNRPVVPGVDNYLENFKNEIAADLGITNYDQIDKGALPARVHGMIGGTMTKRLIEMGQLALAGQNPYQSQLNPQEYVQHMQQDLQQGTPQAYGNAPVVAEPTVTADTQSTDTQVLH